MAGCEHNCTNTVGDYNCTCESGHALATDLHNCLGKLVVCQIHWHSGDQSPSQGNTSSIGFIAIVYPGDKTSIHELISILFPSAFYNRLCQY